MRAIRIDGFGGFDRLRVEDVSEPRLGIGDVLVRTIASAINPVDDKTRRGGIAGAMPAPPMVLGWDVAGVVLDPGAAMDDLRVGDRVFAMVPQLATGHGTWADLIAIPAHQVARAPEGTSLVEAATLPLPGLTAWQALAGLELRSGQRLLVAGGTGAVGGIAVQLARHVGVEVHALVSRPAQVAAVRALGAEQAFDDPAALEPGTYDAVFDTFGAPVLDAIADGGRYTSVATEAGPVPDLSHRKVRTTLHQVSPDAGALAEIARLVDAGALRARVHAAFPLHRVREAHEHFARGGLTGKIALTF
ncbi:NADPH:quinone reductase [Embleya hyalina]|uniref:NADPH:quinone reductase n=2 Tax=Embleya hyalina TaxID=516124 RepID=A0A401YQH4_9ACTN|nr:NADPH:quinone reductase [Embleya hyalina]